MKSCMRMILNTALIWIAFADDKFQKPRFLGGALIKIRISRCLYIYTNKYYKNVNSYQQL